MKLTMIVYILASTNHHFNIYNIKYKQNNIKYTIIEEEMNGNSIISTQLHSYTLVASYTEGIMRISIEVNHSEDVLFVSNRYTDANMPTELKVLF